MRNLYIEESNLRSSLENTSANLKVNREESRKMTGFASLDKPWLKYYNPEDLERDLPKMKVSDYLMLDKDHMDTIAIKYFGNNIKYEKLYKKIIETARSYANLGIKPGDTVAFCVPTIPETIYSFYALNMLGATSCWIDPRTGVERIKNSIDSSSANSLVTVDLAIPKINKIIDQVKIDKVISVSPFESLPYGMGHLYKGVQRIKDSFQEQSFSSGYTDWTEFMKNGRKQSYQEASYDKDHVASIIYTSGTSSNPKSVLVTDDGLNALAFQYGISGVKYNYGDHFLNVMPAFLLYGLACGIHMPLKLGLTNIVIPQLDFSKMGSLMNQYKPQIFMVNPQIFKSIISDPKMQDKDLSYIISAGVGGSKLEKEEEAIYNHFLQTHHSNRALGKGYGLTEGGSAVAATLSTECDKFGSVGIPLPKNTISIFKYSVSDSNPDEIIHTDQELRYGEEGEICVCGPTLMKGYLDDPERTNMVLRHHSDGKLWLHSCDRGYMDSDGNLFVIDRIGRMIIRPDSHNVYLASIEAVIRQHPAISDSCVVGVKPEDVQTGKYPKAVLVLKPEYKNQKDEVIAELIEMCSTKLQEREVPYYYEVLENLPIALSGKIDYKKLEKETVGYFVAPEIKVSSLVKKLK